MDGQKCTCDFYEYDAREEWNVMRVRLDPLCPFHGHLVLEEEPEDDTYLAPPGPRTPLQEAFDSSLMRRAVLPANIYTALESSFGDREPPTRIHMKCKMDHPAVFEASPYGLSDEEIREGLRDGSLLPEGCENPMIHAIHLFREGRGF